MLLEEWTVAQTFELYGPTNYSTEELSKIVDREIMTTRRRINIPKAILKPTAYWLNKLIWWPTISADEVEREFLDQVIDPNAKTFKDFGIEPAELTNLTFHYLVILPQDWQYLLKVAEQKLTTLAAWIQKQQILRSSGCVRERESGREKISPCFGRPIEYFVSLHTVYTCLDSVDFITFSAASKIKAQPCTITHSVDSWYRTHNNLAMTLSSDIDQKTHFCNIELYNLRRNSDRLDLIDSFPMLVGNDK